MVDFINQRGYEICGERSLDIGGGSGTTSRLLTMEGRFDRADTLDIQDFSDTLTREHFIDLFKRFKSLSDLAQYDDAFREKFIRWEASTFGYHPQKGSKFFNFELDTNPTRNDFIVSDFINTEEVEKYDFINAILCLEYFDIYELFNRVSDILRPGGMFFFIVNNWWWPVNSTGIVGDFPYACQRLTREDLCRYFKHEYPEEVNDVLEAYDYFHKGHHPSINEYVNIGYEHGLFPIGSQRFVSNAESHSKAEITPRSLEQSHPGYLSQVLYDIHELNTTVSINDLISPYVAGAFIKPSC
jgi:SAM-dependent methyltransferase